MELEIRRQQHKQTKRQPLLSGQLDNFGRHRQRPTEQCKQQFPDKFCNSRTGDTGSLLCKSDPTQ